MKEQFLKDVDQGLKSTPKKLPSKYFYDKKGDELFVKIMHLPEYYLTRSEDEIFTHKTDTLIQGIEVQKDTFFELIELGAGDGSKTVKLLHALSEKGYSFEYIPIDISQNALNTLSVRMEQKVPNVKVEPKQGDYFGILESLKESKHPKVVLFLGSNIGNMNDEDAAAFIYKLGANLHQGDKLVLGVDLIKSREIVLPAYNDNQGITKEFNLNLLHRINKELQADFVVGNFTHIANYTEEEGIAKSFLKSKCDQVVTINTTNTQYHFKEGELMATEVSRKYNDLILQKILKETDFSIAHKVMDAKAYFANYILHRS